MQASAVDVMITNMFSAISKVQVATKVDTDYAYVISVHGVTTEQMDGLVGVLTAEKVEQYEGGEWYEVKITRGQHTLKEAAAPAYSFTFEVTRKEMANTPAVYQKSQYLWIDDTLADLDDGEIIPQNKQVNNIAEMQDRQSDFTAQFKVRKTRAMRALFQLAGEVGANSPFPYLLHTARLVQDGIEIITRGALSLLRTDDQYYNITIYSGNSDFFKNIDGLKLTDLLLPSTNHNWNAAVQAASNVSDLDYVYPLCEPSDDGGVLPLPPATLDRVEVYGGQLWPFVKVSAIIDEIFATAGFTKEGEIFTDPLYLGLYMPIVNLNIAKQDLARWLWSGYWQGWKSYTLAANKLYPMNSFNGGDHDFMFHGNYTAPFGGTYTLALALWAVTSTPSHVYIYADGVQVAEMTEGEAVPDSFGVRHVWEGSYEALAGVVLSVYVTPCYNVTQWTWGVTDIEDIKVGYGSDVTPALNLPDMGQTEFIKTLCNMFGLIPETDARRKVVKFWNYELLYRNIPRARDWSAYLNETDKPTEYKFGEYAKSNYLRYKDSEDVVQDTGVGVFTVNDNTLPEKKDAVQLAVSTCDEVYTLSDVVVARINFNRYDDKTDTYVQNDNIDPRLVYVQAIDGSKTFGIRDQLAGGTAYDSAAPKTASTNEISMAKLVDRYFSLGKMLTSPKVVTVKLNLPAYEVAGFKHYTPVYFSQMKAYYYVNRINNYVLGRLCEVELIKL